MNIIVLLGKSGSGKDAMQNLLINYLNDFEIIFKFEIKVSC